MSGYTFQADFCPGQPVKIVALERRGVVELVRVDEAQLVGYFVNWWDEGERKGEWLRARELASWTG